MLFNRKSLKWAAFALIGLFGSVQNSNSQSITLGGDDKAIFRLLQNNGYTNPTVTKRGLTIIRTEACKGAEKYQVKVSILGRITSTTKIGSCAVAQPVRFGEEDAKSELELAGYNQVTTTRAGPRISATACRQDRKYQFKFNRRGRVTERQDVGPCRVAGLTRGQITQILRRDGYQRIVVTDDQLPRYSAEACRDRDRLRIHMNRRGIIRSERRIGVCGRQFDPNQITALLEKNGYDRIEVIDKRRPPYVAQACRDQSKLQITIGRYGRITRERNIGSCLQPINPANLAEILGKDGYDRVVVIRSNRTPYLVEACKRSSLMELTIGRFGQIRKEERVGRCAEPITKEKITEKLNNEGYLKVAVSKFRNGWRADVCREENKLTLDIDVYGDVSRERRTGQCPSQTVLQVLQTLESRGADKTKAIVEGCYRGVQFRWEFDRLGNRTGRTRIGKC